jgi:hypothetical protein
VYSWQIFVTKFSENICGYTVAADKQALEGGKIKENPIILIFVVY